MKTKTVETLAGLTKAQLQKCDEITVQGTFSKKVKKMYAKSKEELMERKRRELVVTVLALSPSAVLGDYYILRSDDTSVVLKRL